MNYAQFRRFAYKIVAPRLGGRLGATFDWLIMGLIILNISAVMLATVNSTQTDYATELYLIKTISVAVFTIEYIARVWSATESRTYADSMKGRLRFALRPLMIVDLLVLLPFYLTGLLPATVDTRMLRAFRLLRVLRLLKLAQYSSSIRSFGAVFNHEKERLVVAAVINSILLVVSSSVMYQLEHTAQPDKFSSIPQTLWWGAVTLTTVGYGDMYPVTEAGQLVGAIIAVFGIGLFALPASILAAGFIKDGQEQQREQEQEQEQEETGSESDAKSDGDSNTDSEPPSDTATDDHHDSDSTPPYCPHCGEKLPHAHPSD